MVGVIAAYTWNHWSKSLRNHWGRFHKFIQKSSEKNHRKITEKLHIQNQREITNPYTKYWWNHQLCNPREIIKKSLALTSQNWGVVAISSAVGACLLPDSTSDLSLFYAMNGVPKFKTWPWWYIFDAYVNSQFTLIFQQW